MHLLASLTGTVNCGIQEENLNSNNSPKPLANTDAKLLSGSKMISWNPNFSTHHSSRHYIVLILLEMSEKLRPERRGVEFSRGKRSAMRHPTGTHLLWTQPATDRITLVAMQHGAACRVLR